VFLVDVTQDGGVHTERLSSHWADFGEILYFDIFKKICQENSSFIKIRQE
jgi:hypothetical protein